MRAFWKYNWPYALSGKLTGRTREIGGITHYETKEYGVGFYFTPILILSDKNGLKLKKQLKEIESKKDERIKEIWDQHNRELNEIWKSYKKDLINV